MLESSSVSDVVEVSDVVRSPEELLELEAESGKVVCKVIVVPSETTTTVVEPLSSEEDPVEVEVSDVVWLEEEVELEAKSDAVSVTEIVVPSVAITRVVETVSSSEDDDDFSSLVVEASGIVTMSVEMAGSDVAVTTTVKVTVVCLLVPEVVGHCVVSETD